MWEVGLECRMAAFFLWELFNENAKFSFGIQF